VASTDTQAVLTEKERWVEAISLDPETGLDPPGHKVRAAQGLDAASEFIQGYWIWQKVVQNLATLGYDTNTMDMAAYDWRLAYYNLEIRDQFLSRLKSRIELMHKTTGKKVVLASHSMGGSLALFFFKWVEAEPDKHGFGGGGGKDWVENHIEAWANVAGTLLGVPKAMTAFMSGEMRDTVELHPLGSYVLEKVSTTVMVHYGTVQAARGLPRRTESAGEAEHDITSAGSNGSNAIAVTPSLPVSRDHVS